MALMNVLREAHAPTAPGCGGTRRRPNSLTAPLAQLLHEMGQVVEKLGDEQYRRKPVGVFSGSIGGHVRHSLDHIRALVDAVHTGRLDYDHRRRGTPVETDRWAALEIIRELTRELHALGEGSATRVVSLRALTTAEGGAVDVTTTLGREAVYALSHTIHHNAMIAAIVKTLGGWTPSRFGYAPSTVVHLRDKSCAP